MVEWYLTVWRKYADFTGRARRKEYWYFALGNFCVYVILSILRAAGVPGMTTFELLYAVAAFIPSLAVSVRRLHDTNRSWVWLLIGFVPIIGAIILLIFFITDSNPGPNPYGPNPKANEFGNRTAATDSI